MKRNRLHGSLWTAKQAEGSDARDAFLGCGGWRSAHGARTAEIGSAAGKEVAGMQTVMAAW